MVDTPFLRRNRKYAVLISFVVAAILTPTPDVVNQLMMAGPLMVLYEVSILAVAAFARKKFVGFPAEDEADEATAAAKSVDSDNPTP
jgi:sec-independent protein translocase protein TatC